jgi:peptidoglycan DL-endopeptidase CwlO
LISPMTQKFIDSALAQVGKPYQYGAAGPNAFDCAGLVQYCLEQAGVTNVPRTSEEQWAWSRGNSFVSLARLQPGDLIFEQWPGDNDPPGHVCIFYEASKVIEAPHTGEDVHVRDWSPGETTIIGYGRVAALNVVPFPKPVTTVKAILKEANGAYRTVCPNCKTCFDVEPV